MGLPMALHLRASGAELSVSDNDPARRTLATEQGLTVAADSALALKQADGVFSSLPHDAALLKVAEQVATHAQPGTFWVDTSTVSLTASTRAAQICAGAGVDHVRTTVSGNNKMAEAAQLTVLASGPRATYDQVLPLLQHWGPNQFYLGQAEQARLMKLVINLMIAQTSAMLGEALTLGRKGGLDWHDMWRVMGASAVASPIVKAKSAQLSERDFSATFTVNQMVKDLDLILGAASDHQRAHGDADADYAAIIKATERSAGLST